MANLQNNIIGLKWRMKSSILKVLELRRSPSRLILKELSKFSWFILFTKGGPHVYFSSVNIHWKLSLDIIGIYGKTKGLRCSSCWLLVRLPNPLPGVWGLYLWLKRNGSSKKHKLPSRKSFKYCESNTYELSVDSLLALCSNPLFMDVLLFLLANKENCRLSSLRI